MSFFKKPLDLRQYGYIIAMRLTAVAVNYKKRSSNILKIVWARISKLTGIVDLHIDYIHTAYGITSFSGNLSVAILWNAYCGSYNYAIQQCGCGPCFGGIVSVSFLNDKLNHTRVRFQLCQLNCVGLLQCARIARAYYVRNRQIWKGILFEWPMLSMNSVMSVYRGFGACLDCMYKSSNWTRWSLV